MCINLATEGMFHHKIQYLTCEWWGATSYPVIYFQRETPLPRPLSSPSPFSVAHIWTTSNAKKKKRGVEKGWEWKKNVEMFSSGCNLSLSRLQHSRVILQHSPVRRTEVALCLGLTQAHIHLKPLLTRLPQSVPAAATAPHPRCCWASHCIAYF